MRILSSSFILGEPMRTLEPPLESPKKQREIAAAALGRGLVFLVASLAGCGDSRNPSSDEGPAGASGRPSASAQLEVQSTVHSTSAPSASAQQKSKRRCAPPSTPGALLDGFRKDWPIAVFDISSDGCRVVASNNMHELILIDVSRWATIASIHDGEPNRALRVGFLDDDRFVYCGGDDGLHLWVGHGAPTKIATLPGGYEDCMNLAVDRTEGRVALTGYHGGVPPKTLRVFDLTGKLLATRKVLGAHAATLSGAWFTGLDDISANTSGHGTRTFLTWADTAPEVRTPPSGVSFFGLGGAKEYTGLAPRAILGLVEYVSGARREFPREHGIPRTGAFSRDGSRLFVFFQSEGAKSGVATYDYPSLKELRFEPLPWASDYVLTVDGTTVLATSGMDIVFFDAFTGEKIVSASVREPKSK